MADGRTVVVTGGTGALGTGVVDVLVAQGYAPLVTWVVERERAATQERYGARVRLEQLDVTDAAATKALGARLDEGGGAWGLAHLVGGYRDGEPVAELDPAGWEAQIALNMTSAAYMMRALLPGMVARGGGRVVAVSSRAALRPFPGSAAYAASKAGLLALVGAAAEDVKHDGVTVNCVLPSVIDTPANRAAQPDADPGRWVGPTQIGETI
ncbi:MAG TPA: SDR family NAD(P)-dependent oxidoreductase, partial [Miltoncostaeaceae bacterium]|nr:SDR family NAD(P)-dependent oxidoreductase [Miltoncostaeaceae bacterium]